MPTLNIKDPEVHRMAHELARRRQTTATGAVRDALSEALGRGGPSTRGDRGQFMQRIADIQREAAESGQPYLTDCELYDADGLPR